MRDHSDPRINVGEERPDTNQRARGKRQPPDHTDQVPNKEKATGHRGVDPVDKPSGSVHADPKRMGAKVGLTSVLHTWGSAMTHHPHIHMIVPGGGQSPDGTKWVASKPGFFLHVRVLSRLFRRGQKPMSRAPPRERAA